MMQRCSIMLASKSLNSIARFSAHCHAIRCSFLLPLFTTFLTVALLWQVCRSFEGWRGGGSVPIPLKNIVGRLRPFLAEYDASVAGRQRCVPHIKTAELYQMAPLPLPAALPVPPSSRTGVSSASAGGGAPAPSPARVPSSAAASAVGDSDATYDAFPSDDVVCLLSDSDSEAESGAGAGGVGGSAGTSAALAASLSSSAGASAGAGAGHMPPSAAVAAATRRPEAREVDAGFLSSCDEDDADDAGGGVASAARSSKSRRTTAASASGGVSASAGAGAGSSSSSSTSAAAGRSAAAEASAGSTSAAGAASLAGSIPVLQCLYTGSHNLSAPAWGEVQMGMVGGTQLFCRSFELGVLALPSFVSQGPHDPVLLAPDWALLALPADMRAALTSPGACPRLVGVPLPYALPPRRYGLTPTLADRPYDWSDHGDPICTALRMGNQAALDAAVKAAATDPYGPPPAAAATRGRGGRGGGRGGGGAGAGGR